MGDYIRLIPVRKGPAPPPPSTIKPPENVGINEFDGGARPSLPPTAPAGFALPEKRPKQMHMPGPDPHFHVNKLGVLEACYHRCREINWRTLGVSFFMFTCSFPVEHYLWEKLWPLYLVTKWMGI